MNRRRIIWLLGPLGFGLPGQLLLMLQGVVVERGFPLHQMFTTARGLLVLTIWLVLAVPLGVVFGVLLSWALRPSEPQESAGISTMSRNRWSLFSRGASLGFLIGVYYVVGMVVAFLTDDADWALEANLELPGVVLACLVGTTLAGGVWRVLAPRTSTWLGYVGAASAASAALALIGSLAVIPVGRWPEGLLTMVAAVAPLLGLVVGSLAWRAR